VASLLLPLGIVGYVVDEGMEVVGLAGDGVEAVTLARQHDPDVVLMDLRMPKMDRAAAYAHSHWLVR
jgi:response regulator NasT